MVNLGKLFIGKNNEINVSSIFFAYNRREIRDKRPLGRDSDRNRCHLHTSLKLFWLRPMAPWISVAAYECVAAQSMDLLAAIKKASQECGGDTSSCSSSYSKAACPEFHVGYIGNFSHLYIYILNV